MKKIILALTILLLLVFAYFLFRTLSVQPPAQAPVKESGEKAAEEKTGETAPSEILNFNADDNLDAALKDLEELDKYNL